MLDNLAMFNFIVFWAVALSSIACLLTLSIKTRINSVIGWIGSLSMVVCSLLPHIFPGQVIINGSAIGFAFGAILFIIGLYIKIKRGISTKTDQRGEAQSKTISDILLFTNDCLTALENSGNFTGTSNDAETFVR